MLASLIALHEDELRADLMEFYGIDLDRAMAGEHSAVQVAACAKCLPQRSRLAAIGNKDNAWGLSEVLLAYLANSLNALIYGMSDKRRRGKRPDLIGPSWMAGKDKKRSLPARAMPVNKLMEELSKPRRAADGNQGR